nr:unnamed protein product [Callosobruchus analis]
MLESTAKDMRATEPSS